MSRVFEMSAGEVEKEKILKQIRKQEKDALKELYKEAELNSDTETMRKITKITKGAIQGL